MKNDENLPVTTEKKKFALWQPGQSGNPNGRPKGSRNAITLAKLQVESELRGKMKKDMGKVLDKIVAMALEGDADMLKLLYKSWVSTAKSGDDEAPKERVQIVIGKLDQIPAVKGRVINEETAIHDNN